MVFLLPAIIISKIKCKTEIKMEVDKYLYILKYFSLISNIFIKFLK